jgi:hypothetical protein
MQHLRRARVLRAVLLLLAVAVVAARVGQAASAPVFSDDLHVYRDAARAALDGGDAWVRGFVYLPAAVVAFLPMAWLPAGVAAWSWLLLSAAVVITGAWRLARWAALPPLAVVTAVFLIFPTESALQFGNVTALQFGLLVAAVSAARANRTVALGWLLGVGIVLKPVLVVCLLVPTVRRQFGTVAAALVLPVGLSVVVLAVVGDAGGWLRTVRAGLDVAGGDPASADLGSTLARLHAPTVVTGIVVLGVVGLAALALRAVLRPGADAAAALLVPLLVVMLLGSVAWAHYPLLLVPLLVERLRAGKSARLLAAAAAVCLVLPEVLHRAPLTAVPPAGLFLVLTVGLVLLLGSAGTSGGRTRECARPPDMSV